MLFLMPSVACISRLADKRAAIGFIYDDGSSGMRVPDFKKEMMEEEVSDEEIDLGSSSRFCLFRIRKPVILSFQFTENLSVHFYVTSCSTSTVVTID